MATVKMVGMRSGPNPPDRMPYVHLWAEGQSPEAHPFYQSWHALTEGAIVELCLLLKIEIVIWLPSEQGHIRRKCCGLV